MHGRQFSRPGELLRAMKPVIMYRFRVRDSTRGAWRIAAEKMTLEHVRLVYGEGNYEKVDGSQELLFVSSISAPRNRRQPARD